MSVLWKRGELEAELINRQVVFPCMILQCACQKALWEEEPRDPERLRVAILNPMLLIENESQLNQLYGILCG